MDASITASVGAMGSLIGKLDELLSQASEDDPGDPLGRPWLRLRLPKGLKHGAVRLLKEDLEEISTYLEDLSEVEDPPLTAECWMKEVRELSYDVEDYIDSFARPGRSGRIKTKFLFKTSHVELNRFPKRKKKVTRANKISDFRIRAQDANDRHKRYELDYHNFRRRYAPVGPMLPTPYKKGADLVIDGTMREFIDTLASDGDQHLKVVSVVGSGGLGKTTLVKLLYNKIRGQFHYRALIQMTRKPNVRTVLREILSQVQRQQSHDYCDDFDLINKIRKHLQNKRYLIIIDDLWTVSVWNIINRAFPEGGQRSRIIITTQIEDIALECCNYHSGFVLEMRPKDSYHSRKLFFNRVFGSECECPDTFKEVSNKIVEICGGLPLATISMASLLANYPVALTEQWAYISDSLSSKLRAYSTTEGMRQVLNLSYNNLTKYLKTCLLYLNMYPEGYTICKGDLVKQWVAEGFIGAREARDMERVAGSYFDELIDRRFLQPACIKYNNAIMSCTVHDAIHDLIAYKSAEENFVMVVDNYRENTDLCHTVHRLSLQLGDSKHAKKPGNIITSKVRSLSFFGFFIHMPSIADFKLLRVLNLQLSGHHGDDLFDLTGISELFHLRYLKVASDVCIQLPECMRGLQYLETLDMDTKVTVVPMDIVHLPRLLHLHLPFETNLMDWISSMNSESVLKLHKPTNLRDLRLTCSYTTPPDHLERNMEALGHLLAGLGNLTTLALVPGSCHKNAVVNSPSKVTTSWNGFAAPLLEIFEWSPCSCTFSRVPKWIGEFGNLCVLKIAVRQLLRDGVDILKGLPSLTTLSLYVHSAPVKRIVFDKVGFSVLKYFKFRCSEPWLNFEAGAMPSLSKLKLGFNAHRQDQRGSAHISIQHLPGLKEISLKIRGSVADADSALTTAVINHPSNPQINIQLVDCFLYGDKVRNTATEKKEHERIEKNVIMKEPGDDISIENVNRRKTEEKEQGRIEQNVIMEDTKFLVSRKDEDENKQTRETKHETIEQDDIMEEMENEVPKEDENKQAFISNFTPYVPSSHLPVPGKRSTRAASALSKAQVQDGYITYPWEKKMRDTVPTPNSSCYLSILVLPKALDSNACHYESYDNTLARANAWLYSSQASGIPIFFMNVQSEALLTKISGETASVTVNSGSLSDLLNIANATLYGFKDYHGADNGVVKAARLWYYCVGELLLEIPLEEGDTRLGFAISRTEEGFIYISSVVENDMECKAPSTRSGLCDLFNRAKEASKLLVISRVSNEKVLPWMISSSGDVRCFDTISLSQKLSLHRLAVRTVQLHLLAWEESSGPVERIIRSPKLPPPSKLPPQLHQNLMDDVEAGVHVEEDLSFLTR